MCASPKTSGKHLANGPRLLKIDDQSRPDHSRLTADDECFYFYEYTSGKNYAYSETNSLISNLKKKRGAPGYPHKILGIEAVARVFAGGINRAWLDGATLVPVPPSKAKRGCWTRRPHGANLRSDRKACLGRSGTGGAAQLVADGARVRAPALCREISCASIRSTRA